MDKHEEVEGDRGARGNNGDTEQKIATQEEKGLQNKVRGLAVAENRKRKQQEARK